MTIRYRETITERQSRLRLPGPKTYCNCEGRDSAGFINHTCRNKLIP